MYARREPLQSTQSINLTIDSSFIKTSLWPSLATDEEPYQLHPRGHAGCRCRCPFAPSLPPPLQEGCGLQSREARAQRGGRVHLRPCRDGLPARRQGPRRPKGQGWPRRRRLHCRWRVQPSPSPAAPTSASSNVGGKFIERPVSSSYQPPPAATTSSVSPPDTLSYQPPPLPKSTDLSPSKPVKPVSSGSYTDATGATGLDAEFPSGKIKCS